MSPAAMTLATVAAAAAISSGCGRGAEDPGKEKPPPAPDSIHGRTIGLRGGEIGWRDRSGGEASFIVEHRMEGAAEFEREAYLPPGTTSYRRWGVDPGSRWSYRVRATGSGGESAPSGTAEIRTPPAQVPDPRVEVFDPLAVSPGATLFNVEDPADLYRLSVVMAVDEAGQVVWHFEETANFTSETDVFPDGDVLIQIGPAIARVEKTGEPVWYVDKFFMHHDVDPLPWGNVIGITSVALSREAESVSDDFARDWIVEVDPRTLLLERAIHLEFLVPTWEQCRICISTEVIGGKDWLHANAVEYDVADEAIYVSVRNLNRIYKLSYPEAEVLWVMGDGGDFGQGLFHHQHNPVLLEPGRMLLFDNGLHRDPMEPDVSRVMEIEFDPEAHEARIVWEYAGPPAFFSEAQGDASRLPNGNTLVVVSFDGRIVEVTPEGLPVWELKLPPPYLIYKAHRIKDFP